MKTTTKKPDEKRMTPETLFREMTVVVDRAAIEKRAADEGDERIPISISSETPVARMDWWSGEMYNEVLDHSRESIDLSYAADGLPFLADHNIREQVGIVEDISIGDDKVIRGLVRFSQRASAKDLRQDMVDGIRKKISVGYRQLETVQTDKKDSKAPIEVRVTRWLPMEASSVAIPADYSVGVGRSRGEPTPREVENAKAILARITPASIEAPKANKEHTVDENEKNTAAQKGAPDIRATASADERKRAGEIIELASQHGFAERAAEWVGSGKSMAEVSKEILDGVKGRASKPIPSAARVELNDKERKNYSFARAIASQLDDMKVEAGFEREVSQEIARKLPPQYKYSGGILIPTSTRAGLDSATSTKGSELKFTQPGEFIDLLRKRMKVRALGARILAGLTGPVSFPKQTGAATATWVGENPGSDVADSNLLLGTVALAIKTLQATTSFSRQLLVSALSASVDAEQLVREDLAKINALAIDLAAINGSGASNQPTGVLNTSGIGSVAGGTNGAAPTYANIVDLETAIASADADTESMGYLTTAVMRGKLKQTQKFATTNGVPVWEGKNEMNGYTAEVSNQVPSTLTKGTSSDCHAIIFGDWSQLVIGEWGALELIADPFRLKKQGMIEVTSFQMADIAVRYAAAFAAMKDARNV